MGYIVGILSVIHMVLMGNKWRFAPLFGVGLQLLWFYYAWVVDKGLLISGVAFMIVHIRNTILWAKEEKNITKEEKVITKTTKEITMSSKELSDMVKLHLGIKENLTFHIISTSETDKNLPSMYAEYITLEGTLTDESELFI